MLLRISVVAFLIILAVNYDGSFRRLVFGGVLLISFLLLIGFLTPFLCVIGVVLVIANMLISPLASSVVCVIAIANAVALALLGPGAYSVDSKLFGRRVTIVRPGHKFYRLF